MIKKLLSFRALKFWKASQGNMHLHLYTGHLPMAIGGHDTEPDGLLWPPFLFSLSVFPSCWILLSGFWLLLLCSDWSLVSSRSWRVNTILKKKKIIIYCNYHRGERIWLNISSVRKWKWRNEYFDQIHSPGSSPIQCLHEYCWSLKLVSPAFPCEKYPGILYDKENKDIMDIITAHN